MSDEIDGVYANSTVSYNQGQESKDGFDIYYILYGYERDSLPDLFPIIVVSDNGEGTEAAEDAVIRMLQENEDFYIRSPGIYDPPAKEIEEVSCQIGFNRLSPNANPDLIDGARPEDARAVFLDLLDNLREEQGNLYYDSSTGVDLNYALFWISFEGSPEIRLPFPTRPPDGEIYEQHPDTVVPCYVLTEGYDQRQLKRPIAMKWLYPVV